MKRIVSHDFHNQCNRRKDEIKNQPQNKSSIDPTQDMGDQHGKQVNWLDHYWHCQSRQQNDRGCAPKPKADWRISSPELNESDDAQKNGEGNAKSS